MITIFNHDFHLLPQLVFTLPLFLMFQPSRFKLNPSTVDYVMTTSSLLYAVTGLQRFSLLCLLFYSIHLLLFHIYINKFKNLIAAPISVLDISPPVFIFGCIITTFESTHFSDPFFVSGNCSGCFLSQQNCSNWSGRFRIFCCCRGS